MFFNRKPESGEKHVFESGVGYGPGAGSSLLLAIRYPPLKEIGGCFGLLLQAQKGNTYFADSAERAEYGKYESETPARRLVGRHRPHPRQERNLEYLILS